MLLKMGTETKSRKFTYTLIFKIIFLAIPEKLGMKYRNMTSLKFVSPRTIF